MTSSPQHSTKFGTLSGTALSVLSVMDTSDVAKTVLLAMIGAAVSFIVSTILKQLWNRIRRRQQRLKRRR